MAVLSWWLISYRCPEPSKTWPCAYPSSTALSYWQPSSVTSQSWHNLLSPKSLSCYWLSLQLRFEIWFYKVTKYLGLFLLIEQRKQKGIHSVSLFYRCWQRIDSQVWRAHTCHHIRPLNVARIMVMDLYFISSTLFSTRSSRRKSFCPCRNVPATEALTAAFDLMCVHRWKQWRLARTDAWVCTPLDKVLVRLGLKGGGVIFGASGKGRPAFLISKDESSCLNVTLRLKTLVTAMPNYCRTKPASARQSKVCHFMHYLFVVQLLSGLSIC